MAAARFIGSVRVIAALTMVSRVLGLLRDTVCAAVFGASGTWAAFTVAFRIPNLFRRLFGEGALAASFIPIFSQRYHTQGSASAEAAARQVIGLQVLVLAILTAAGELVIGGLWLFGASTADDPESRRNRLTLILAAIMLPHVLSVCTTALLGGMLNVLRNFWLPTFAPIILNVFEVAGVIVAWSMRKGNALPRLWPVVVGVMIAGVVQVLIPWWALHRRGIRVMPKIAWNDPAVLTVVKLMVPTALGLAAVQINTLMDVLIAMWFVPRVGAPVILDYAQRLYQLPLGVIGISVATAIFEQMSAEAALKQIASLRNTALEGLKLMLFVGLPTSVGMCMLTWPLTAIIFQRGRFTPADTDLVAYTSLFFTLGIWAYMSQHVYARGFYALQKPQIPARIAMYMVALNLTLNLILVRFMAEAGLALSTAVSAYVQIALLSKAWRDLTGSFAIKGLLVSLARTGAATAGMAVAILATRWTINYVWFAAPGTGGAAAWSDLAGRLSAHHHFGYVVHLLASMLVGVVVFWTLAHALGCPETRSLLEGLGRRRAGGTGAADAVKSPEAIESATGAE
jgi:putative peptidoglycan lipid II flippase